MSVTGKELKEWGVPSGPVFKELLSVFEKLKNTHSELHRKQAQRLVRSMIKDPKPFLVDSDWAQAAKMLMPQEDKVIRLNDRGCFIRIFGHNMIEGGAINQIHMAAKLPVSVQAALMPDGHQGYGLPIGGVLATDNVVIPYAVGVDIGCRMHLSVTDIPAGEMEGMRGKLRNVLLDNTFFNAGSENDGKNDDPLLDDERFNIPALMGLRVKAQKQLGTSGGGNHFVEYGVVKLKDVPGEWLAVLSHSGSRGFGYGVATHYTKLAMEKCVLQRDAKHLAWLSLDDEDGKEYWDAMELCGDYARACHKIIHRRILGDLKAHLSYEYENHHNFAWKGKARVGCTDQYRDVIIHRKGATPADKGVTGIIPGSMSTFTYIVEGRGHEDALCSSSHGAGRLMSRTQAKESLTMSDMKKDLISKGIELIGGSLDECSAAYKDIEKVMAEQRELVEVKGTFMPWMVRMGGDADE